jgi:hypothetical protein
MLTNADSRPASPAATRFVQECDFCGRTVHQATAGQRGETEGNEQEPVTLCVECTAGID